MFQALKNTLLLLKDRKKTVVILIISTFFIVSLLLLEPIFFRYVIDTILTLGTIGSSSGQADTLWRTLIIWGIVGLMIILLKLFITIYADRMAHEEFSRAIRSYFTHTLHLSIGYHTDTNSGKLTKELMRGSDNIFYILLEMFRKLLPAIVTILLMIPILLFLDWRMGGFVVLSGITSLVIALLATRHTFRSQEGIETYYTKLSAHYIDTYSNIFAVKSFTLSKDRVRMLDVLLDERLEKQYPVLNWWGIIISFTQVITIIITLGVITLGSDLFLEGSISIGMIVMFLGYSTIFLASIETIMWSVDGFFWRTAATGEFFETLHTQATIADVPKAKKLSKVRGEIVFQDVVFSYDAKREILKKINLSIRPGEKVAFVGHTGSGKTTMTHLILRFYDIQSGSITIDGVDIRDVTENSLRENIGVVFQDSSLFDATILENILLDQKNISESRIEDVVEKSHIKEFIARLPDGLSTLVGERGVKLSGGEKQRLAIARALLKDAPILILDEATSALDAETEKYLQSSLETLMQDRTTIIIAHRLSTIRKVDTIYVFRDGEIVETGSYRSLLAKKGYFSDLVKAQTDGFIED